MGKPKVKNSTPDGLRLVKDLKVFYSLVFEDLEKNIALDFWSISTKFQEVDGTSRHITALMLEKEWNRVSALVGGSNEVQVVQNIKNYCQQKQFLPDTIPIITLEDNTGSGETEDLIPVVDDEPKMLDGLKFLFINKNVSDVTVVLAKAASDLVYAYGGIFVREKNINQPEHRDVYVVSFGPHNDVLEKFLDKSQHDIYSPTLVFNAVESNVFDGNGFIMVDHLRWSSQKKGEEGCIQYIPKNKTQPEYPPLIDWKRKVKLSDVGCQTVILVGTEENPAPPACPPTAKKKFDFCGAEAQISFQHSEPRLLSAMQICFDEGILNTDKLEKFQRLAELYMTADKTINFLEVAEQDQKLIDMLQDNKKGQTGHRVEKLINRSKLFIVKYKLAFGAVYPEFLEWLDKFSQGDRSQ